MDNYKEQINEYNASQYSTIPLESLEFPVGAGLIHLSQHAMHSIQWHWHDELEFLFIQAGYAKILLPDKNIFLAPGDCIFLTPNLLHSIRSIDDNDCTLYTFKFDSHCIFGYNETSLSAKYVTPVIASPSMQYLIIKKGTSGMEEMLELLDTSIKLMLEKNFGYELKVKGYICQLWNLLLPFFQNASLTAPSHVSHSTLDAERIKDAIIFIQERYMEPLTLDDIAASIHVSKSECCRCFQRALGLTAFDYLLKYRIFESTRKIMRGDKIADSISTLAASVGFNNASYYNKIFKKYVGCTPTEYKKTLQNNIKNEKEDT